MGNTNTMKVKRRRARRALEDAKKHMDVFFANRLAFVEIDYKEIWKKTSSKADYKVFVTDLKNAIKHYTDLKMSKRQQGKYWTEVSYLDPESGYRVLAGRNRWDPSDLRVRSYGQTVLGRYAPRDCDRNTTEGSRSVFMRLFVKNQLDLIIEVGKFNPSYAAIVRSSLIFWFLKPGHSCPECIG